MKFKASTKIEIRKPFRLLVCGSRTFTDHDLLFTKLEEYAHADPLKPSKVMEILDTLGFKNRDLMAEPEAPWQAPVRS